MNNNNKSFFESFAKWSNDFHTGDYAAKVQADIDFRAAMSDLPDLPPMPLVEYDLADYVGAKGHVPFGSESYY